MYACVSASVCVYDCRLVDSSAQSIKHQSKMDACWPTSNAWAGKWERRMKNEMTTSSSQQSRATRARRKKRRVTTHRKPNSTENNGTNLSLSQITLLFFEVTAPTSAKLIGSFQTQMTSQTTEQCIREREREKKRLDWPTHGLHNPKTIGINIIRFCFRNLNFWNPD